MSIHGVQALLMSGGAFPWPNALDAAAGGLEARYDFATNSNVTLSGAEITAATDLSGNGHTLSPPSASERPAFAAGVLNGRGGADFSNSTTSELKAASFGLTGEFTFGFVVSGGTDLLGLFDGNPGATFGTRFFNNNQIDFMTGVISAQTLSGSAAGTNIIVTISVSGGAKTGTAYKSGTSSATAGATTTDSPTLGALALGTINGGANGDYQDYIHEFAVWTGVLSAGERGTWDDYILAKWGI